MTRQLRIETDRLAVEYAVPCLGVFRTPPPQLARQMENAAQNGRRIQFFLSEEDIVACRTPDSGTAGHRLFAVILAHNLWDVLYTPAGRQVDYMREVYEHPEYLAWSARGAT